jgi:TonB family protein
MLTVIGVKHVRSLSQALAQLFANGGFMSRHLLLASALLIVSPLLVAQAKPQPVHVTEETAESHLIKKVPPVYPPLARQARIQGTVIAHIVINTGGEVESVQLFSGHSMLSPAAIEAIKQWKFQTFEVNGEPVEVETRAKVNFTLAGNPPAQGTVASIPGGIPPDEPGGIIDAADARDEQASAPKRVRVSEGVEEALSLKKVPPDYPQEARDQRIQGSVVLKVTVDKQGNVATVELISGHPTLAPAAMNAVKQWKYKAYLLNQQPVEVETRVTVNFTLRNN